MSEVCCMVADGFFCRSACWNLYTGWMFAVKSFFGSRLIKAVVICSSCSRRVLSSVVLGQILSAWE